MGYRLVIQVEVGVQHPEGEKLVIQVEVRVQHSEGGVQASHPG